MKIEKRISLGQVVVLKSGSQKMTVEDYCENVRECPYFNGYVKCVWFEENILKREKFHQDSLLDIKFIC